MSALLAVVALATFLLFALAAPLAFRRDGPGWTPGRALISLGAVSSGVAQVWLLALADPSPALAGAGLLLFAGSWALFLWTTATHRRSRLSAVFSEDLPEHLVEDGPYAWVRHPFYLAYLLAYLAGTVASASGWLALTVVGMGVLYLAAARQEEAKFARSPLAQAHAAYRARTGMLLPRPWG